MSGKVRGGYVVAGLNVYENLASLGQRKAVPRAIQISGSPVLPQSQKDLAS